MFRKILISAFLLISGSAFALDLATQPLATQGSVVPPNLLFIMDDSGSMGWDYLPDYVDDSSGHCKNTSGIYTSQCKLGDPPYMSADFNKIYYDPRIQYDPPKNADGTNKTSMTAANTSNWTSVKIDGYGIQSTGNKDIVNDYSDRKWCKSSTSTECQFNTGSSNAYNYPDSTYNTAKNIVGAPYYYLIKPSEYCTSPILKNCIVSASPVGLYTYPSNVRWCTSSSPASQTDCQSNKVGNYKYVRYSPVGGNYALGTLSIGNSGSSNSVSITSVKVNGVEVMGSTVTASSGTSTAASQQAVATSVAAAINTFNSSPEYTATSSGNVVTIKPATSGTGANGYAVTVVTPSVSTGAGVKASGTIGFDTRQSGASVGNVKIGGITITNGSVSPSSNSDAASKVAASINAKISSPDYVATVDPSNNTRVIITAADQGTSYNGTITISTTKINGVVVSQMAGGTNGTTTFMPVNTTNLSGGADGLNSFARVDILPGNTFFKYDGRVCAAAECSYSEEMTNFANWYAYYRTRTQMMKTSVGFAFQPIDARYRVGYFTINNNQTDDNVDINAFDDTQKSKWYTQLYKSKPNNSTPLRSALSKAGQIFGGKNPAGFTDPVLFSCQQNFSILSTDGYWNSSAGYKMDGAAMGNADNDASLVKRPLFDGGSATNASDTLSDVSYYYHYTDLRNANVGFSNAFNTSGKTAADVSTNNVADSSNPLAKWQHMTTFTMGLGIDGVMNFSPSYATDTSGDYYDVKNGTTANPANGICPWQTSGECNWPKPASDSQNNIDDLWHAAVNGHGTYFSASNPKTVAAGLRNALATVARATGSSSASATSSPNITAYDNFIFSSTYRTADWDGEVIAQTIDPATGLIGTPKKDPVTGQIVQDTTPLWSVSDKLDQMSSDIPNRKIYSKLSPGVAKEFKWNNLNSTEQLLFSNKGSLLSQYLTLSSTSPLPSQRDMANDGELVVDYLRGDKSKEGSVFRVREHLLGDTVNSVPSYVKAPLFNYVDAGYLAFKESNKNRAGRLYIGANDGMLHAFNATASGGNEEWAFIPHAVMPNLYKLTDMDYANKHQYFVDGSPVVMDVYDGSWKSILVSGLNHGGKGFFALDITNPGVAPKPLWEICNNASLCSNYDANIGWSYGNPIVTKLKDGKWVVIFTSGYESVGNYLYVVDAITGQIYHKVAVSGANGLSKISFIAPNLDANNTALLVYGGDLDGNLWRFDFRNATTSTPPTYMKFAEFPGQPITTKPEVGLVKVRTDDYRIVVYVGTGKYIENADSNNVGQQSLYALVDNGAAYASLSALKKRTITGDAIVSETGASSIEQGSADWTGMWNPDALHGGWYVDFPSSSERVNLDPQLVLGTLTVITNSPNETLSCGGSGGESASYQFRYDTGLAVKPGDSSAKFVTHYSGITVGNVIFTTPSGKVTGINTSSTGNKTPETINITKGAKSKRNALRNVRR